jgi:hypothetical protein
MPLIERPALVFALFAGAACFAVAAFAPQIFNDADTYWHIAAGNWMLDHHSVLTRDVFSFTFAGQPWDAHEWLSEILIAGVFRTGGWNGLHLLVAAAIGVTAATVAGYVRNRVDTLPALLSCVLGLACTTSALLARPHVLALPCLAVWSLGLLQAREAHRPPSWWLVPVMTVWANLHGSFAFGLVLGGALALEAVVEKRDALPGWVLFLSAATLAAVLTPQGLDGLVFPIKLMAMSSTSQIGEWAPTDLAAAIPFDAALVVLLFAALTRRLPLPWIRAAIVIGLAYMAIRHQRHQMLFGVVVPMVAATSLARRWPAIVQDKAPLPFAQLGAAVLAILVVVRVLVPATRGEDRVTPASALASVPAVLRSQPVLSAYDFGGYLIFEGVRPFIDGRADMYGDAFMKNYDAVMKPDRQALSSTLLRWRIAWTLLPPGPAADMMDRLPGWHRSHSDRFAVVHIRD